MAADFVAEFKKRRGYDPEPFFPAWMGMVVWMVPCRLCAGGSSTAGAQPCLPWTESPCRRVWTCEWVLAMCHWSLRSQKMGMGQVQVREAMEMGLQPVLNLAGGVGAWTKAGGTLVRG